MKSKKMRIIYIIVIIIVCCVGFTLASGRIAAWNAEDINRNWINVKDFGATGDSTTVDTNAFIGAFDAAVSQNRPIKIPVGTYNLTGFEFEAAEDLTIVGESKYLSVLKNMGTITHKKNIHIENLSVTDMQGSYVIAADPGGFIKIEVINVYADNSDFNFTNNSRANGFGFYDHDSMDAGIEDILIENCEFYHFAQYIFRYTCNIKGGVIRNNIMNEIGYDTNTRAAAIHVGILNTAPAANMLICDNKIQNIYGVYGTSNDSSEIHGIFAFGDNITIDGNIVNNIYGGGRLPANFTSGYDHEAIYTKVTNSKISNNQVTNGAGEHSDGCIVSKGEGNNIISGNIIKSAYSNGIYIRIGNGIDAFDNTVNITGGKRDECACMYIEASPTEKKLRIWNNNLSMTKPRSNGVCCIKIDACADVEISNNHLYSTGEYVIKIPSFCEGGLCKIYNNQIIGLNAKGISVFGSGVYHQIKLYNNDMVFNADVTQALANDSLLGIGGTGGECEITNNHISINADTTSVFSIGASQYTISGNKASVGSDATKIDRYIEILNTTNEQKINNIIDNETIGEPIISYFLYFRYSDGTAGSTIQTVIVRNNIFNGAARFVTAYFLNKLIADGLIVEGNHVKITGTTDKLIDPAVVPDNYEASNNTEE